MPFERMLYARWGDMDFNGHMKNTAYLDASADVRMMYFAEHGFSMREFERLRFGPVILKDELEYYRELRLLEPVKVTLEADSLSEDGMRFRLRNEFFREDGTKVAKVTSDGGWLDLDARKLKPPPDELRRLLEQLL
jgi:acyl-CoA thioester hydrolase